jgi:hypothetical protein
MKTKENVDFLGGWRTNGEKNEETHLISMFFLCEEESSADSGRFTTVR